MITVGLEIAEDTVAVAVWGVAQVTLTRNPVETHVCTAGFAAALDPEVALVAVTLTVSELAVESTVLVVAALSSDD